MEQPGPADELCQRFHALVGLIRHEYWLHGLRAEDFAFEGDADTLTLRAKERGFGDTRCAMTLTTEQLLTGDLYALARAFFKEHCQGVSVMTRIAAQVRRRFAR